MAQAGSDIDAYCSKCRMELMHVVIACNGEKVARVECKTCRGQHAYKHAPASANKRGTSAIKTKKAPAKTGRNRPSAYEEALGGRDTSQAQTYRAQATFFQGDIINHHSFGYGVVIRQLSDAKVQVAFGTGEKVLVHDRTPS